MMIVRIVFIDWFVRAVYIDWLVRAVYNDSSIWGSPLSLCSVFIIRGMNSSIFLKQRRLFLERPNELAIGWSGRDDSTRVDS